MPRCKAYIALFISSLVMAVSLLGCGQPPAANNDTSTEAQASEAAARATIAPALQEPAAAANLPATSSPAPPMPTTPTDTPTPTTRGQQPTQPPVSGVNPPTFAIPNTCTHTVGNTISASSVKPGDVICVKAGTYSGLNFSNLKGTATQPIIIKNTGGQVIVNGSIDLVGNAFFRFTGSGTSGVQYGFKFISNARQGSGATVNVRNGSTNMELDHFEVIGGQIGIGAHSKCTDGFAHDKFVQRNTVIHDTYIHNIPAGEGMYLGNNDTYPGSQRRNGCVQPVLKGLWVYNNRVTDVGKEAINAKGTPKDCFIYNNTVERDSRLKDPEQAGGIAATSNTSCNIFNNTVKDGWGPGIQDQGNGGNKIYNNTVINAGQGGIPGQGIGIHIQNGAYRKTGKVTISSNTITNPATKAYEPGPRGILQ
jgi:parallel beta-helix repeat protein